MAVRDRSSSTAASPKRRSFLLTLGTGGVAAVAAAIKPISDATPELQESAAQAGQGYRETEHIRDYYRTTKI
jgi:hypothetical protein